jgi:hypothetical protein
MIIISIIQQEKEFTALEQAAKFAALLRPTVDGQRGNWQHKKLLIPPKLNEPRSAFADIAADFSKFVAEDNVTLLVSQVYPLHLNPLLSQGLESLLAMLILAFPEVRWFFGTIRGYDKSDSGKLDDFRKAHGLHNLFRPEQSALFDGSGLRDWVRQRAFEHPQTKRDGFYLPRRKQLALALDEETPYAFFHAYTAYRFGFRAATVTTAAAAKHFLRSDPASPGVPDPELIFEDIYVNFPDGEHGMSDLPGKRHDKWGRLEKAAHRIFVTSGYHDDPDKWAKNQTYIDEQKATLTSDERPKHIHTLFKPYAGIFRLWEEAGLFNKLQWPDTQGKTHRGVAKDFIWPPPEKIPFAETGESSGHSAPGILLVIAELLIARSETILSDDVDSVPKAVHGAVLVTDALELLGGRTPTVAVEALRLKHRFEVLAECQFSGVEHHIQLKGRLIEIERDANIISHWFGRKQKEAASLNAKVQVVIGLMRVFRDAAQFDEEQVCLREVRKLNRHLWFREQMPWVAPIYLIRLYVEFLLGSIPRFVGAIGVWILVLTVLFAVTSDLKFTLALKAALSSFIGIQPPEGNANLAVTTLAMLSGATHLGIFISHLYTLVSRK